MADNTATLVRMANQIADFFIPYPEAQAVSGVREHIKSFWTPQMRKDLAAHVAAGGEGLRPAVVAAFVEPSPAKSPVHKAVADANELGQLASDAG